MKITAWCHIRNQKIFVNGKLLFQHSPGNLNDFLDRAYDFLKPEYPKFYKMDRLSKLGFLAAEVLLRNNALAGYAPEQVSLVLSNASASLDSDLRYAESAKTLPSPSLFVYTLPNIVAGEICIRHKIKGENAFFISEKFDAELMASYAAFPNAFPMRTKAIGMTSRHSPASQMPSQRSPSDNASLAGWVEAMGEHHDVFLYLMERNADAGIEHSASKLEELYHQELWNN